MFYTKVSDKRKVIRNIRKYWPIARKDNCLKDI